jgi:glycosyltransferase involved in cell wall biosynthesis
MAKLQRLLRAAREHVPTYLGTRLAPLDNPHRLLILDDIFPDEHSAFRVAEFHAYFDAFEDSRVYSTGDAMFIVGENRDVRDVIAHYEQRYPQYRSRVQPLTRFVKLRGGLAYSMFLDQMLRYVPQLERDRVPFAFTLYTNGGFFIGEQSTLDKLKRINDSPMFRKLIVTQNVSLEFIQQHSAIDPDKLAYVYGIVAPPEFLRNDLPPRVRYGEGKDTFDVCFVGNKYLPCGEDKGYDVFIESARRIARARPDVHFHVVGRFDGSEMPMDDLRGRITFYGSRRTEFFLSFYALMDVILAPNKPFTFARGAFDSFPNGGAVEAGLCGVAVFITDMIKQNSALNDGKDIVIVPHDADQIAEIILSYFAQPDQLYALSKHGQITFRRVFGADAQIAPRIKILHDLMS